jgi:hypothetical protein
MSFLGLVCECPYQTITDPPARKVPSIVYNTLCVLFDPCTLPDPKYLSQYSSLSIYRLQLYRNARYTGIFWLPYQNLYVYTGISSYIGIPADPNFFTRLPIYLIVKDYLIWLA